MKNLIILLAFMSLTSCSVVQKVFTKKKQKTDSVATVKTNIVSTTKTTTTVHTDTSFKTAPDTLKGTQPIDSLEKGKDLHVSNDSEDLNVHFDPKTKKVTATGIIKPKTFHLQSDKTTVTETTTNTNSQVKTEVKKTVRETDRQKTVTPSKKSYWWVWLIIGIIIAIVVGVMLKKTL